MQKKRFALRLLSSGFAGPSLKAFFRRLQCSICLWLFMSLFLSCAQAGNPMNVYIQPPQIGDNALNVLSPNLLELFLVNTKQPDPATVDSWDWVNDQQAFVPPDISSLKVIVKGQTNVVTGIGFKRRARYGRVNK